MKKINIKVILPSLMCVFTLASAVTATYAWGTASRYVNLSNLEIGIQTDAVIKVGLRNQETEEIKYYEKDEINQEVFEENGFNTHALYKPVSSSFKDKWMIKDENDTYNSVLPELTQDYSSTNETQYPGKANYGFRQFELFFTADEPVNITFSATSTLFADTATNHDVAVNNDLSENDLNSITNAMRISILTEDSFYIIDPTKTASSSPTYYGGRLVASGGYYKTSLIDGEEREIPFGEYDETKLVYDNILEGDVGERDINSIFKGVSKAGTRPLNVQKSIENGAFKKEESTSISELASNGKLTIRNWKRRYEGDKTPTLAEKRIVVTYYIEGWDEDNIDTMAKASFKSLLVFNGDYAYKEIYA